MAKVRIDAETYRRLESYAKSRGITVDEAAERVLRRAAEELGIPAPG
jgi:antitoxin component of RelBE/YafQ-DinJ toxin-antitoxin module